MELFYGNGRVSYWVVRADKDWIKVDGKYYCQFCGKDLSFNRRLRRFCSGKCENEWYRNVAVCDFWERFRYRVFSRDNNKCVFCGKPRGERTDFVCDHIIPLFKGGRDWWEDWEMSNFQTLCPDCNKLKTAKDLRISNSWVNDMVVPLCEVFWYKENYGGLEKFLSVHVK